jgi:hypothetical protein
MNIGRHFVSTLVIVAFTDIQISSTWSEGLWGDRIANRTYYKRIKISRLSLGVHEEDVSALQQYLIYRSSVATGSLYGLSKAVPNHTVHTHVIYPSRKLEKGAAEASLAYGRQACALVVSTMLGIWQICGGKGEYEDVSELQDLEGRRSKVTAELRQATNSGSSKRAAMKQDLGQWDVKDKATERIERSR